MQLPSLSLHGHPLLQLHQLAQKLRTLLLHASVVSFFRRHATTKISITPLSFQRLRQPCWEIRASTCLATPGLNGRCTTNATKANAATGCGLSAPFRGHGLWSGFRCCWKMPIFCRRKCVTCCPTTFAKIQSVRDHSCDM